MGEITTRTIGPDFDGEAPEPAEETIEEQLARLEVVDQFGPAGEASDLPGPEYDEAGPEQGPRILAQFAPTRPMIYLQAILEMGDLQMVLTVDEAEELVTRLGDALLEAGSQ